MYRYITYDKHFYSKNDNFEQKLNSRIPFFFKSKPFTKTDQNTSHRKKNGRII